MFRPQTSKFSEAGIDSISATCSPPTKHVRSRISLQGAQISPMVGMKTPESGLQTDIYSVSTPVDTTHFVSSKTFETMFIDL